MSGSRSKTVSLKSVATAVGPGASSAGAGSRDGGTPDPVTVLLSRLHERCRPALLRAVQSLFDHADDALFELADKAGSNGEQNMYFESMREVRIRRRGIELALNRDLQEGLRCLGRSMPSGGDRQFVNDAGATLALLDHDELEEIVAVDTMTAKAEKAYSAVLTQLTARFQTLVPGASVTARNHPLGPACLCDSFLRATGGIELDIKARLVLFKLFDRHVVGTLGDLYRLADRWLADEGIEPYSSRRGTIAAETSAPPAATADAAGDPEQRYFADLHELLEEVRETTSSHSGNRRGLMAPGLAPALPRGALMQMLGEVQRQQVMTLAHHQEAQLRGATPRRLDVLRALDAVLLERLPDRAVSIGQVDDDAINLVSMLFQFVLDDRNLAAPIKGLIARLQIPILKVALLDRSFFAKGGHPARKLLNELANASLGWNPAGDLERDALYVRIRQVVELIVDEFVDDVSIFHTALAEFTAFAEMEQRRAALVEQRTIDAEDGRARAEVARRTVEQTLSERLAGRTVPSVVIRLLEQGWSNVLFLACLKEGIDSEAWRRALTTVDELLASVEPVESLSSRARLLKMLPNLLKSLRSGLGKVGVGPFQLNDLFEELEQLHLQRLRKEEMVAPSDQMDTPASGQSVVTLAPTLSSPLSQSSLQEVLAESAPGEKSFSEAKSPAATERLSIMDGAVVPAVEAAAIPVLDELPTVGNEAVCLDDLDRELAAELGDVPELSDIAGAIDQAGPCAPPDTTSSDHSVPEHATGLSPIDKSVDGSTAEPAIDAAAAVAAEVPSPLHGSAGRAAIERIDRLQVGGWVELKQVDGKVLRCRLAAIIRATGKFIFVNRAGVKVAENTRQNLAELLAGGALNILDEGRLFDRALESVIGNLREMRRNH